MGHSDKEWKRLGDGSLITEDAQVGLGHIVPVRLYNLVFTALLMLTIVTVWVAQYDIGGGHGAMNLAVAMLIATIKAALVTLYFMHLNWESKITWGIVIYPLFIFALIVAGTLGDFSVKERITPSFGHAATEAMEKVATGAYKRNIQREQGTLPDESHHGGEHH